MNPIPAKTDINPATGKAYAVNPATGNFDDNYWANTVEPGLKAKAGGSAGSMLGMGGLGAPTLDLQGLTTQSYNTPEIQAAKKAITDRQQALVTAQAEINDNPFYSEATRVGKSDKLTNQANADISVQQKTLDQLNNEAEIKINAAKGQYDINEQAYKDKLNLFDNLVSSGALTAASPEDLASMSVQTGIPLSMINSIVETQNTKNNPLSIHTSTDDAGNLNIIAVDKNGNVTNKATVAGAAKATKTTGSTTTTTKQIAADKAAAPAALTEDVKKNKMTLGTAMALYQQYGLTPQKIYDIYLANAPASYNANSPASIAHDTALYNVKHG